MWTKPTPSKDWPMHECLYECSGSGNRVGRVVIRKSTFGRVERGEEYFLARGIIRLHDAGPGALQLGPRGAFISPCMVERGSPFIHVRVEYSLEGFWRWVCDRGYDLADIQRFPEAWWVI